MSIPLSRADSIPVQQDHSAPVSTSPVWKDKRTTATVSFAADVEVIVSTPVRSSPLEGPASPGLLQPSRELSLPIPQCDMSNTGLAAITITPPAYVLFPFDDPFDGVDLLSTSPVSTILAPIRSPESLATPSVIMDMLPQDFPPPGSSVSLFTSGLLSPCQVQPIVDESSEACCSSSPSVSIPTVDSPVESVLTGSSSPLVATVPDVG